MLRNIVVIDEEKCDGCGQCVDACHEGAIAIVNGKAKLISDIYCDGLGDCIGDCPQDAITVEKREVRDFDPKAVQAHLAAGGHKNWEKRAQEGEATAKESLASAIDKGAKETLACGCPGTMVMAINQGVKGGDCSESALMAQNTGIQGSSLNSDYRQEAPSSLTNWPVQITLLPVNAPYLKGADLLIAGDCTPFAFSNFHHRFIRGRIALVGCPKLDNAQEYVDKLATVFENSGIRTIEIAYMQVPCCGGLLNIVRRALEKSGANIPVIHTMIGMDGQILKSGSL